MRFLALIALLLAGILVSGPVCAQDLGVASATAPVSSAQAGPAPISQTYVYRLGSGDKVRVIVFGEGGLGGEFTVSGDGIVSLPLVGDMKATGLTAGELQTSIEAALKDGYLNDPKVNVEVLTFRPFYILGEVKQPGQYAYSDGLTVTKAVALAQGYTYRADKSHVYVEHAGTGHEDKLDMSSSMQVQPGDTIRFAERYF